MDNIPDNTNWVTNSLLVGGLPRTEQDFNLIKSQGINVFVNLMSTKEATRGKKKPPFDYREVNNRRNITYLNFPVKDLYTLNDNEMIKIAKRVVDELGKGNKVYIHCLGGHGRTGTLAGIVLHFLYPDYSYEDILKYLNDRHKTRVYKPNETTPQTAIQFNQLHRIITGKSDIFFYLGESDPNFVFSNYYQGKNEYLFEIMNTKWISNESFFQASKYNDNDYKQIIQNADTSHKAFLLGRMGGNIRPEWVVNKQSNQTKIRDAINMYKNNINIREDWDEVKDKVMIIGLFCKFTQNKDLYDKLLSTGDTNIVEYSPVDTYWGTYWNKNGQNKLGQCLMIVRKCLRLNVTREYLSEFSKSMNWNKVVKYV